MRVRLGVLLLGLLGLTACVVEDEGQGELSMTGYGVPLLLLAPFVLGVVLLVQWLRKGRRPPRR